MSRVTFEGKLSGETLTLTFDFTSRLAAGETISTASTVASVYSGTDPSPSSLINGPAIASGQKVTQSVIGGVLGVTYELLCSITTSGSQLLQLSGFLTIVPDME